MIFVPCFHPLTAYRAASGRQPNGKWPIVFSPREGFTDMPVTVPCGQCYGCRLERSRMWAVRCMHEASLHSQNCFITLTFDDDHLDSSKSLRKEDFVKFMKRFRKKYGAGIRFFHCGEYGSLNERPHHHAIIFGFDLPDKQLFTIRRGIALYTSNDLFRLWPFGFNTIGDVTFESCAYVARYIMKKINGKRSFEHYAVWDEDGSYLEQREKEYITMSRNPGIAHDWFEKFQSDVFPRDEIIIRDNLRCKPPKYYETIWELSNPDDYVKLKLRRKYKAAQNKDNNTPDRLKVRENVALLRTAKLLRTL